MKCPECGSENLGCVDSRESIAYPGRRRRRHKCKNCGQAFATIEIAMEEYEKLTASRATMDGLRKIKQRAAAKLLTLEKYDGPGSQVAAVKAALRYVLGMED